MSRRDLREQREIELKLELDPAAAASFRHRAIADLGPPRKQAPRLTSTYFDTRKQALRRRGLSLRVREGDGRRVQTLKADGGAGVGLFRRREWESAVPNSRPDPERFDDANAADLIRNHGPLAPVFATAVERTTWLVAEGGSSIEVVVDEGTVAAGDATAPLTEVELELKDGSASDLFRLARRLAQPGELRISARSKSEKGYALADGGDAGVVKAPSIRLSRRASAGDAFQAIARSCLRHFRLNEAATVEGRSVEALHQARVAMRRLRSALSLFRRFTSDPEGTRVRAELRRVSGLLGEARNLDVFLAGPLAAETERHPASPGLAALTEQVREDRERAYDRVVAELGSAEFRLFTVDLAAWVEHGEWSRAREGAKTRDRKVGRFAARTLDARRRKVEADGRGLAKASPEERHRVRIDAKKLRYASEFFADLTRGGRDRKRQKAFVARLAKLGDALGELNDIATARELTTTLAAAGDGMAGGSSSAAGHLSGEGDDREASLVLAAVKAHRKFVGAEPYWS